MHIFKFKVLFSLNTLYLGTYLARRLSLRKLFPRKLGFLLLSIIATLHIIAETEQIALLLSGGFPNYITP